MNENVLDVLLYLFENFSLTDVGATGEVRDDLGDAGFFPDEIDDAFDWLRAAQPEGRAPITPPSEDSVRIYAGPELYVLDAECRGYIARLERAGVLSAANRELVIDRLMALVDDEFEGAELEQVKWVVMMVLSSADGQDAAYARMEAMLYSETPGASH
ncbi:DUF494 domain-containing protein [Salinisphaera sp. SPP-AMP-43]|uniref:DUF494 family protein n=1 Tax=Salinisphaera sp. SPP-AMP-43 TaxID=3121288 RepID=UPI003C6DF166